MALTRKFLKALEIEGDKAEQIIEAHAETLEGLKTSLEGAQIPNPPASASSTLSQKTWNFSERKDWNGGKGKPGHGHFAEYKNAGIDGGSGIWSLRGARRPKLRPAV